MAVLFLAVLLLFVVQAWSDCRVALNSATCQNQSSPCTVSAYHCSYNSETSKCVAFYEGDCGDGRSWCYQQLLECGTKCQADSAVGCPTGSHWNNAECKCDPDPQSSSSSIQSSSSSVDCTGNRTCCDSLNVNRPVDFDTLDLGCGPVEITDSQSETVGASGCEAQHSYYADGSEASTFYMCNGLFYQRICATEYVYDGTGQCIPMPSTDCYEITNWEKSQTECQNIRCDEVWENELSDVTFNNATKCYEGRYRLMLYMVCSNGTRTLPSYGEYHPYKVCH